MYNIKILTIISLFIYFNTVSYAQTFYVEKTDGGYEQPILDKLIELKKEITSKPESSNYTIQCVISRKPAYGKPGEGYVIILETVSGNLITKSESAEGMVNMFRGFKNPKWVIMEKVAKRHLEKTLELLKSNPIIPKDVTVNNAQIKSTSKTKEDKLVELKQLFEKKLITNEEYEAEKKKILSE
jgi:hypothetical protein